MVIQMAISRSREYDADRMGAAILGKPMALASALAKIAGGVSHIPNEDAERHPATAPLFIINPLSGRGMDNLFSTYPATENRIAALQALAQEMGQGVSDARAELHPLRLRPAPGEYHPPSRTLGLSAVAQPDNQAGLGPRRLAWEAVSETLSGAVPLDDVLDELSPAANLSPRDEALARAICIVTFRRLGTIGNALRERLNKGQRDERLLHLLAIGAAQILFLDVPDHAAVDTRRATRAGRLQAQTCRRPDQRGAATGRPGEGCDPENRRRLPRYAGLARGALGLAIWRGRCPPDRRGASLDRLRGRVGEGRGGAMGREARRRVCCRPGASVCSSAFPCATCRVTTKAHGGFRMPPRLCRRACSRPGPANALAIFARLPAARPRNWRRPAPKSGGRTAPPSASCGWSRIWRG